MNEEGTGMHEITLNIPKQKLQKGKLVDQLDLLTKLGHYQACNLKLIVRRADSLPSSTPRLPIASKEVLAEFELLAAFHIVELNLIQVG